MTNILPGKFLLIIGGDLILLAMAWNSKIQIKGLPLLSAGFAAKGIIAVGFSGIGFITIAQFGVGFICITQFGIGVIGISQFNLAVISIFIS